MQNKQGKVTIFFYYTISFEEKTREITGGKKEKKYENEEKTNVFKSNLLLPFEYYFIQSQSWSRGA